MRVRDFLDTERILRNLDDRVRQIVGVPLLDGDLFKDVAATTTGTEIFHGFGRTPKGALVVRADTAATYTFTSFDSSSFTVTSSADSTIDLWVF